ncbi:MAG: metalloregulator ArsR/SmtB family transcription factor [Gemmatimonadaceae bacterium]|nr:metalloregulator ArsR/SmtB family transcription factor [Gemmatimonadaceae bacterium]
MTQTHASVAARAAEVFHALSDETRIELIHILRKGEKCVCDLTSALDAAQSRLSFHLKVLKDAGLVTDRKQGRWVHYELNDHAFAEAHRLLTGLEPHAVLHLKKAEGCC